MQANRERTTLRAILFADLQQYSRLTAANELATLDFVTRSFEVFREHCTGFGGEFVKTTGDGVLILFDSASSAVDYAMSIQDRLRESDPKRDAGRFRIGIHLGEVRQRGGDVYGHAVNLAARIESQAEPGGVCVTEEVYRAARGSSAYGFRFGSRAALRNIPEPVTLYHVFPFAGEARDRGERLTVSVIDGLSVASEAGEPLPLRSKKGKALVGYLALATRSAEAQDRVAALIWPERSLAEARRALANCAKLVENAVGPAFTKTLVRRGTAIGLNPSRTQVDLIRIFDDLSKGKVDHLLLERSDWPDAILRGLEATSPVFAAWLSVARHNHRTRGSEALEALLDRFADAEPAVRHAATALLLLEPSHERAAQHLVRHHAACGNLPAAMRVYENLRQVMRERFKLAPSASTDALIRNLANPSQADGAEAVPRRIARPPRLALGPFRAHRDELLHAASGFRANLIANLSKFRELTILETHEAVGSAADYLLTAQSADAEGGVELFVTLEEPGVRRVVWSDSFVLGLHNWLEAQKRLVGRIASSLEVYLSQDRLSRTLHGPVHDLGAYDAWLRGEHLLTRWTPSGDDEAMRLFEHAIAEDPQFAPAYASLASVHNSRHLVRPGVARDAQTSTRALELAERAVGIDPLDARNHLVVAWSTAMAQRFEQSEVHYELAAELNQNSPRTLVSAALGLAFMGRGGAAARLLDRAMTLTPLFLDYQWSHIAAVRCFTGDFEGAVLAADRSKNVIVDTPGWKAVALRRLGRKDEARIAVEQLHDAVSAAWQGEGIPTREEVVTWFLSAFPLRREEDRAALARLREPV